MGLLRHRREGAAGTTYRMREKMFSIGADYWIETESGERAIKVNGKALRIRDTLVLEDRDGRELVRIQEKKLRVRDTMEIERGRGSVATVKKALVGIRDRFSIAVQGGDDLVLDGGLVIDLSLMRRVDIDGDARIAHSQGGATWLDFDSATQAFGLVTPGAVVGSTGVAGLTFGGGIGHLTAQHGLTCDNLVAAEVVTPDGTVVRAGADDDAELLWGLRGGGGNFGVATRLEFRLHPLERVVGGRLQYAGKGVSEALRRFRDVVAGAPRDLSCGALLALDASLEPTLTIAPCYTGSDTDAEELRVLRSAPRLVSDGVGRLAFLGQQHLFNPPYGEDRNYWKSQFVSELPDELIDELLQRMTALERPPGQVLFESLHGAPKEADANNGAVGFRRAAFNISAMASWQDPALDPRFIAWARDTAAALGPWSVSGGYVNYMQADEPIERVRAAFGDETFERLRTLKRRYDPNNVLRRNQNIPPGPD